MKIYLAGATSGLNEASSSDNFRGTSSVASFQQVGPSAASAVQSVHQGVKFLQVNE